MDPSPGRFLGKKHLVNLPIERVLSRLSLGGGGKELRYKTVHSELVVIF